ncbi:hypothetical protein M422DRAFT_246658 [Sphaerobolus stellatus SS14]|nr:hypothetical protein M422DRAFT_246658 [Sphaerobolus stellatus SS14]
MNDSCISHFQFLENQQGDSPCVIIDEVLRTSCKPKQAYPVSTLSSDQVYPPPTPQQASPCLCNTVTYTLLSSCILCQGLSGSMPPFPSWTSSCSSDVQQGKLPNTTAIPLEIPEYAFQPLPSNGQFVVGNAIPSVSPTSAAVMATTTMSTTVMLQTVPSSLPASTETASRAAVTAKDAHTSNNLQIVIAVVVVVTFLVIIAITATFFILRRRNGTNHQSKRNSVAAYFQNHRYSLLMPRHHRRTSTVDSDTFVETPPPADEFPNPRPGFLRRFFGGDNGRVSPFRGVNHAPVNVNPQKIIPQNIATPRRLAASTPGARATSRNAHAASVHGTSRNVPAASVHGASHKVPSSRSKPPSSPRGTKSPKITTMPLSPTTRPDMNRFETFPAFQTITRTHTSRPQPSRSGSDPVSIKSPTGPRSPTVLLQHAKKSSNESTSRPRPERIQSMPRPADFRIDQTPTAVEPTTRAPWDTERGEAIPAPIFNPQFGASMTSFASQSTGRSYPSPHRTASQDSDSVALLSSPSASGYDSGSARSLGGFQISSPPQSPPREVEGSIRSNRSYTSARSDRTNVSGRSGVQQPPPRRKDSFDQLAALNEMSTESHGDNSPLSPAAASSHVLCEEDPAILAVVSRSTGPDSRMRLFPSSVRAAGYTGVPFAQSPPSSPPPPRTSPRQGRPQ